MLLSALTLVAITTAAIAQTINVQVGQVIYQVPAAQAGKMPVTNASQLTVMNKTYDISSITQIYIDQSTVTDNLVIVEYNNDNTRVKVPGNVAQYLTVTANAGHVTILQSADLTEEVTYQLQGSATNGSFYMDGELKASLLLNGVTLNNPDSAAINIRNGKRIAVELASGTTNTLTDGTGGAQKACFAVKGHAEFKGAGTLNITGNSNHAFWGKEYVEFKKTTGTINILGAVGDGFNVNQYILISGGTITVSGVGDDAMQLSYATDDNDQIETDAENTGIVTLKNGTLNLTTTAAGAKGIKAAKDFVMSGGSLTITQTGGINTTDPADLSYATAVKAAGNINITGGTVNINNTADGGKGLSADGNINISQTDATVNIDIKANGKGGTAESSGTTTPTKSYKVYVSLPTTGGGGFGGGGSNPWTSVYLYKADGTLVQQLTQTVTRSQGYSTLTFYYYDFKAADTGTYYFKAPNFTSRGTTYTIVSATITGPTTGTDDYYTISSGYDISGTTRTYRISNVTATYGGTSDTSEDSGTGYNASGLKADGNITIGGGTVTIANSGEMSKSIKSKATTTINGGNITLTPSGAMKVINSDASYSTGIKTLDYIQNAGTVTINASGSASKAISANASITTNGGTLNITNTGAGVTGSNNATYTAKGLKADGNMALNAGTITINMSGTGGKGIKVNGNYTQGTSGGTGPDLKVTTTGSTLGGTTGGGGGWPGMGGNQSSGSSAKAIKVMGTIYQYGGTTEVNTATNGAEGLESKTAIYVEGGQHYYKTYDDGINCAGKIFFNGGVTVVYSTGNDAIDSNAGTTGAITIGNGAVMAYTGAGGPEEGFDCDNNSYIQITGTGIGLSFGSSQGGGGWGGYGNTISNAKQGYYFNTSSVTYTANRYYTLYNSSSSPLVTFSFPAQISSTLSLLTATGMVKGQSYNIYYSTSAPTSPTTDFHGLYIGGTPGAKATSNATLSFTAQ